MQDKLIIGARASTLLFNYLVLIKNRIGSGIFILPANVCPIVPVIFLKAGITFEFMDISKQDYCIDKKTLKERVKVENKIKGVLFVRSYGYLENLNNFFSTLKVLNSNLILIDDRCLCVPTFSINQISTNADMTLFSTGYSKYIELNRGGFAFLKDKWNYKEFIETYKEEDHSVLVAKMNESILKNRSFNFHDSDWLEFEHKFELKEYQETIIEKIEQVKIHKSKINKIYSDYLPEEIQVESKFNNWRFNIFVDNKNAIIKKLFEKKLFGSSHYSPISHLFGGGLSLNAKSVHEKIVNLFNDYRFTEDMALKASSIVKQNIAI